MLSIGKRAAAEFFGTFWVVFGGCGSAVGWWRAKGSRLRTCCLTSSRKCSAEWQARASSTRSRRGSEFCFEQRFCLEWLGVHSPGGYSTVACFIAEVVLTMFFLLIIMGSTDHRAPAGFAPIAIGLGLTLINLIGIPVTNLSVNPARSTGTAVSVGGWAVAQLWMFWVAPIVGGPGRRRVSCTFRGLRRLQVSPVGGFNPDQVIAFA